MLPTQPKKTLKYRFEPRSWSSDYFRLKNKHLADMQVWFATRSWCSIYFGLKMLNAADMLANFIDCFVIWAHHA